MKTRGEKSFIKLPFFAAKFYDNLTNVKGVNLAFEEIAEFLGKAKDLRKILDIGTGPGRLLSEINKRNHTLELYGLDISSSMVDLAKNNLKGLNVDLRTGNITKTDYAVNYFDCIVCSGSFYLWDKPIEGLDEVYRILKPGRTAFLFESNRNYDKNELNNRLRNNLKTYNLFRKTLSKYFLRKQLKMTYSITDIEELIKQSKFSANYKIDQIELGNLPIWLRIGLHK